MRAGDTLNEGVFSSWNGQSPLRLPPPADLSVTVSEMTSAIEVRSRTSAMSSSRIRPAIGTPPSAYILPCDDGVDDRRGRVAVSHQISAANFPDTLSVLSGTVAPLSCRKGTDMQRSALLTVCLAVFVDMLGFGIILPLLPFHTQDLGGTGIWVGALLTSYAAAQFVAAPILGSLSDRFGRRPVLLAALVGSAISLALTGVAGTLATLLLARVVAGAFGGAIAIGQAYVSDFTVGKARTQALGMIGASIGMGFVFGPAIGALLADLGFAGVSFVAAGVAAANAVLGYFLLPRTAPAQAAEGAPARRGGGNPVAALGHALRNAGLRPLLLVIFAFTFAFVGMEATFALLGAERFGLDARALGLVFAGIGIMMAIVQGGLVGRLSGSFGNRNVAIAGALLLTAGLVILPYVSPWVGYPALGLLAIGQGLLTTTTSALIAEEGGSELGGAFGVSQSASALARALGPLAAGALYDVDIPLPYLLGAALSLLAAVLLVTRRRGTAAAAAPAETGEPAPAG